MRLRQLDNSMSTALAANHVAISLSSATPPIALVIRPRLRQGDLRLICL